MPGQDPGFPFRLPPSGVSPVSELALRGISVLDTDDAGAYTWASVWAINGPGGVGPHTATRIQGLIGSLKQLAEQMLLGLPLTPDRRAVFERTTQELVAHETSSFARQASVQFTYELTEVTIALELHVPYEIMRITIRSPIGG